MAALSAPAPGHAPGSRAASAQEWEQNRLRLKKADLTLLQALADTGRQKPCLILYSGEHSGTLFALQGERLTLGRSPECDVCLESPGVSRRHAEVREEGKHRVLHDLDSSNGTHLNEVRITQPQLLVDGDLVRLGASVLKFYESHSLDALLHDRIYSLATVDSGTDTHTERYLLEALEREVKLARRTSRPLSVLCLAPDHFKTVNDRYGHNAGDVVLRGTAAAAKERLRGSDILGRMGGEEFAVVLPDTQLSAAIELADRVRLAVAARSFELPLPDGSSPLHKARHRQTVSIGAAQLTQHTLNARDLLGAAEAMLHAAKRSRRNCVNA
jgi:diguanylate cyclase (GGDEF)-like protein